MYSRNDIVETNLISSLFGDVKNRLAGINQDSSIWNRASYLLLLIYAFLILLTFQNYGITYDEFWRSNYGDLIIQWYQTGFQNRDALTYWNLFYYGGFSDVVQQVATRVSPWGVFETRHAINALFGLLALTGVNKLGKVLATPFVGFLSTLFLLLTPRFYGHSFNNPIDIPAAALYVISLYFLVVLVKKYPNPSLSSLVLLGVSLGLALGVRISSVLIIGYIGIAFGWLFITRHFYPAVRRVQIKNLLLPMWRLFGWFVGIVSLAYAVMLIWWPAAQVDPLRQPYRSLKYFSRFEYAFNVFFDGQRILNTELPWFYQIKWFVITLPEFMILAIIIGAIVLFIIAAGWLKTRSKLTDSRYLGVLLLLISVLLPLGYTILRKPTDYDGIRHFLFVVPPISVLAALSVGNFVRKPIHNFLKYGILATMLVSLIVTIIDMGRLYPNQYIYFNRLFGQGVAEASQKYDTDYWGNSYKEAVEWVVKNYPVPAGSPRLKVASCLFSISTSYYLKDSRFEYIGSYHDGQKVTETPDIFLATSRWNCDQTHSGEVIHEITRMGATLIQIKQVTH